MEIRATDSVSHLVQEIKKATSKWVTEKHPNFAWHVGYAAFSVGHRDIPHVKAYIANQENHHRDTNSKDELLALLRDHGIEPDERYFE